MAALARAAPFSLRFKLRCNILQSGLPDSSRRMGHEKAIMPATIAAMLVVAQATATTAAMPVVAQASTPPPPGPGPFGSTRLPQPVVGSVLQP